MQYTINRAEKNGYKAEMGYMDYFESYRKTDDNMGTIYSAQRWHNPDNCRIEELEEIIDPKETGCYKFAHLTVPTILHPLMHTSGRGQRKIFEVFLV